MSRDLVADLERAEDEAIRTLVPHAADATARGALAVNSRGVPHCNLRNACVVLALDPSMEIHYDEFRARVMVNGREQSDTSDSAICMRMQTHYDMPKITTSTVAEAVRYVASLRPRNEVTEYLDSLEWDGVPRIESFFPDYFGCPATAYTLAVGRNFLISMCARARKPGCKVDTMPVLEGKQGKGKQRVLQALAGQWYGEIVSQAGTKDFALELAGRWLLEVGEMDALSKAEEAAVRRVLSAQEDRFRRPYARHVDGEMRRSVFVGTSNTNQWGHDSTGEMRRMWPIAIPGEIDVDGVAAARDQLFAEADQLFREGAKWWIMPDEETKAEQRARIEEHPWLQIISDYVEGIDERNPVGDVPIDVVTVQEIMAGPLNMAKKDWNDRRATLAITSSLKQLGFANVMKSKNGKPVRRWVRESKI